MGKAVAYTVRVKKTERVSSAYLLSCLDFLIGILVCFLYFSNSCTILCLWDHVFGAFLVLFV